MTEIILQNIQRAQHGSLASQAADVLRKKIICGELKPGMHLVEDAFAQSLGISKASVRESFQILAREGVLEKENNKYTRVVTFSKNDVREMFEMRTALEQLCIERSMADGRVPYAKLLRQAERVERLIDDNRQTTNYEGFVDTDMRFHEIIVESSGNGRAIDAWRQIETQIKILFFSQLQRHPFSVHNEPELTHEHIVWVMKSGKTEEAKHLIHRHLYGSYDTRINDPSLQD